MVKKTLKLVLLGGTGFVGKAILRRLRCMQAGSVEVRALVRGSDKRISDSFVHVIEGELSNISPTLFPKEPHVVVHFATKNIETDGSGFTINTIGTQKLIDALPSSSVAVIYGSSLSVLGQGVQEGVREDYNVCPQTSLARSRQAAEDIILHSMRDKGKSALVLRPRFILGSEDKSTIPRLVKLFKHGIKVGSGRQAFSVIDVDDYAEIIIQVARNMYKRAEEGRALCAPLHIGYSRQVHFGEIQDIICRVFNLAEPKWKIPVNHILIQTLHMLPFKKIQGLATMLELIGQSHYADVGNLMNEIGPHLPDKNPLDVLTSIIKLYKCSYEQEV